MIFIIIFKNVTENIRKEINDESFNIKDKFCSINDKVGKIYCKYLSLLKERFLSDINKINRHHQSIMWPYDVKNNFLYLKLVLMKC